MCQNRRVLLAWDYDTAVLSYVSLKSRCRTLLSHHSRRKEKEEGEHIYKYFHLLFFVFVKQVIAQKFKQIQVRLNPSEVTISVASFFGDQGYLISFWLTKLFHDFLKKDLNLMGSGGWLHKGKIVVLYENLSTLFYFCAISYLLLKMKWMANKEKKKA